MKNETLSYNLGKGIVESFSKTKDKIVDLKNELVYNPYQLLYPITGNLSDSLQQRISNLTGGKHNPSEATYLSGFSNMFSYIASGIILENIAENPDAKVAAMLIPFVYGAGELIYRTISAATGEKGCASLAGKIVSSPLEGILGIYDGIKKK